MSLFCRKWAMVFLLASFMHGAALAQKMPPPVDVSGKEPVKYVGSAQTDRHFYHGGLRHAVGVHRYQVVRANRSNPPEGGKTGWTYSHAPMLCYWNERFYLQYLSCFKEEHNPPSRTMLVTSKDGRRWSPPEVVFPVYNLPEIRYKEYHIPRGTPAMMHQRMGFYVAPGGRLLTVGFYSFCPTPRIGPNLGQGLGRVVREVYKDGILGPVYFIRYNEGAGWNESTTDYPFYTASGDQGFIGACEDLLADRLITLQWWEMEQFGDDFYTLDPGDLVTKALCYYHRPDGVVVALWKHQLSALSPDEGETWTPIGRNRTLMTCGAKVWGQRTGDGRYALVYNHSATRRNRFPMVVMTGEDGYAFDNMLCLHGEVSPIRYQGIHKNIGTQYVRGIVEGNGNPPGSAMWNTYSMNKEDIWVSRTRVPIEGTVDRQVNQDFEQAESEADLALWNLHVPVWAPVMIATDPYDAGNRCLALKDEDPYEYALAERAFPESRQVTIRFRANMQEIGHALLEAEVHSRTGRRVLRLRFDPDWLSLDLLKVEIDPLRIDTGRWYAVTLRLDCAKGLYDLALDGEWVKRDVPFAEDVETVERIVFRTGSWRADVRQYVLNGAPGNPGLYMEDLPGADRKVPLSLFYIDDVKTGN
jgi:hypothetical protein